MILVPDDVKSNIENIVKEIRTVEELNKVPWNIPKVAFQSKEVHFDNMKLYKEKLQIILNRKNNSNVFSHSMKMCLREDLEIFLERHSEELLDLVQPLASMYLFNFRLLYHVPPESVTAARFFCPYCDTEYNSSTDLCPGCDEPSTQTRDPTPNDVSNHESTSRDYKSLHAESDDPVPTTVDDSAPPLEQKTVDSEPTSSLTSFLSSQTGDNDAASGLKQPSTNEWQCLKCTYFNETTLVNCVVCSSGRGCWNCTRCTYLNNEALTKCGTCDAELHPKVWSCTQCTLENDESHSQCATCGHIRVYPLCWWKNCRKRIAPDGFCSSCRLEFSDVEKYWEPVRKYKKGKLIFVKICRKCDKCNDVKHQTCQSKCKIDDSK